MDTSFAFLFSYKEVFVEASKKTNGAEWGVCFHGPGMNHIAFFSVVTQSCRILGKTMFSGGALWKE